MMILLHVCPAFVIVCSSVFLVQRTLSQRVPDIAQKMRKCQEEDHNPIDMCLMHMIQDIRPRFRTGIPELNVPVMDPMTIPNIDVEENSPLVRIMAHFMQVVVKGASTFEVMKLHAAPNAETVQLSLKIPELLLNGLYAISGSVMLLPIRGNGTFWLILNGIDADTLSTVRKVNGDRLQVTDTKIQFNVDTLRMRLNNLFGGDSVVGEAVNAAINRNSKQLLESVKPNIAQRLKEAIVQILNGALSNLPASAMGF